MFTLPTGIQGAVVLVGQGVSVAASVAGDGLIGSDCCVLAGIGVKVGGIVASTEVAEA